MSNQFGDTRIDDDLTLLSETLEEVLRSSGDPADQKYVELKARAEKALASQLKASKASLRGKGISITRMPGVAGISCDKWRSRFSSAVVSDCTRTSPC